MKTVAIYEARNRLSEILAEVEHGEEYTITRHGEPVARIVAARQAAAGKLAGIEIGASVMQPSDRARFARCANAIVAGKRESHPRVAPLAGELLAEMRNGDG
jgi:prevent-host-death family protein